jgi:hypothetical protein
LKHIAIDKKAAHGPCRKLRKGPRIHCLVESPFSLLFLLQPAEGQLTLPMQNKRARAWTVAEHHAHSRRKAAYKKQLRNEEMSARLEALYAIAPRIGPDGKPLPLANHTRRDGAQTGPQATRSRPSRAMASPRSTPPHPDQAPATPTTTAEKVSFYDIARLILGGVLTAERRLKLYSGQSPVQPVTSATTAPPPVDPIADMRTPPTSTAIVQQGTQVSAVSSASSVPLPGPETAESDLGGFDASFSNENISPTLTGIEPGSGSGSVTEVAPPRPQIQDSARESVAATFGARRDSPLGPSASEHDSSKPLMTTEDMLAGAIPHYESGMQGLNRFLRLVGDGGKKKR